MGFRAISLLAVVERRWFLRNVCNWLGFGFGGGNLRVACSPSIRRIYEWQTNSLVNTSLRKPISIGVNAAPLWLHGFFDTLRLALDVWRVTGRTQHYQACMCKGKSSAKLASS